MNEETVSASHFRVHFKEIANAVARGEQACTVERHGLAIAVVISLEDAAFLREHKWGQAAAAQEEQRQADRITLSDPASMPLDLLEEAYGLTAGTTDPAIEDWRFKAYYAIESRTGQWPARPFGSSARGSSAARGSPAPGPSG